MDSQKKAKKKAAKGTAAYLRKPAKRLPELNQKSTMKKPNWEYKYAALSGSHKTLEGQIHESERSFKSAMTWWSAR